VRTFPKAQMTRSGSWDDLGERSQVTHVTHLTASSIVKLIDSYVSKTLLYTRSRAHASELWMVGIPGRIAAASTAIFLKWASIFVDSRDARIANLEYNATRSLRADVIGEKRMEVVDVGTCVLE
jgi:hypothetical protein